MMSEFKRFINELYDCFVNPDKMSIKIYQDRCRIYLDEYKGQKEAREEYFNCNKKEADFIVNRFMIRR